MNSFNNYPKYAKYALLVLTSLCSALLSCSYSFAKPAQSGPAPAKIERAMFAGGCFWKTQYVFSKVPGVVTTKVGYCGGDLKSPTYQQVCSDKTGHAETVLVEFDPKKTTYEKLLEVFFAKHDPTTMNSQGPDHGTQYRSAIFYTSPQQKEQAIAYEHKLELSHRFSRPIVTQIVPACQFFNAEDYHQNYFSKHGMVCE
jgi:methionine-S-sulfoxide reductase